MLKVKFWGNCYCTSLLNPNDFYCNSKHCSADKNTMPGCTGHQARTAWCHHTVLGLLICLSVVVGPVRTPTPSSSRSTSLSAGGWHQALARGASDSTNTFAFGLNPYHELHHQAKKNYDYNVQSTQTAKLFFLIWVLLQQLCYTSTVHNFTSSGFCAIIGYINITSTLFSIVNFQSHRIYKWCHSTCHALCGEDRGRTAWWRSKKINPLVD